jgi:RNA polymerase sigma factor (sigma-70 family)
MSLDDAHSVATDLAEMSDSDLVLRSRSGDTSAFGELWRRHYRSGIVAARAMSSSIDADDLVQEAYARIFQAIKRGGGPTGAFRAYLFTSIRNTAAAWGRMGKETAIDELDAVEDPAASAHASDEALDRGLTNQAFRSLPTRWQEVLWYTEIEQLKPAEAAPLLGMSANAVAQLAVRAREGLREAWVQAHLQSVVPTPTPDSAGALPGASGRVGPDRSECQYTIEKLGAYARGNLGVRAKARVERHLADCARCAIVASEAHEVSRRLTLVLLPLVIGAGGAAAYLASLQSGGAGLVAVAGMPSSVVSGAVVAGSAGGAGAGASSGGSSGGAGSTFAAFGAVAAGVVAAAAVAFAVVVANQQPPASAEAAPVPGATAAPPPAPSAPAAAAPAVPSPAPASPLAPFATAPAPRTRVAPQTIAPAVSVAVPPTTPSAAPVVTPPVVAPPVVAPTAAAPALVGVQIAWGNGNAVTVTATVRTTPGATVTATVRGFVRGTAIAGADGIATVVVVPKVSDVVQNAPVSFDVPGASAFQIAIADLIARA